MLTGVVNGPGTIDEALSCVGFFESRQGSGTVLPGFIAPPVP